MSRRLFRPLAALSTLALVAACATPQQQCIATANRDLTTVRALLAEAEGNVARGYAIETRTVHPNVSLSLCASNDFDDNLDFLICQMSEPRQKTVPVAIDLELEKRKVAQLRAKEAELSKGIGAAYEACRLRYPE